MAETTYEYLNQDDKNNIIINHIRNLEYAMFNNEISLFAAQNVATPNTETIANLTQENVDSASKIAALKEKMA
jgi:hypothetical protein